MAKILLVEDEANIRSFIGRGLTEFGHAVTTAGDGASAWERIAQERFDLLVMDIMMPKISGLDLCRRFRQYYGYAVPVLMLTALGTTEDIVRGLEAGADDYLVKPFSFAELNARIKALLRRPGTETAVVAPLLACGDLELNYASRRARRGTEDVDLTEKEFRLLEFLLQIQGAALSRQVLLKNVWERDFETNTNVVDVYVNYLRGKVDRDPARRLIHTVVGIGYMMQAK